MDHLLENLKSCIQVEASGKGRIIAHRLVCNPEGLHGIWYGGNRLVPSDSPSHNPWLFEGEEIFAELSGMKQKVQIGNFVDFGRGLVIDGMSQLAEAIEPIYTSALIFPAALTAHSRRRWLIAGGGDGAAPREALSF